MYMLVFWPFFTMLIIWFFRSCTVCDWSGAVQNRADWTKPYQIDQNQIVPDWSGPNCTRLIRTKLYQIDQDQIVPDWSGPNCTRLIRTKLYHIDQDQIVPDQTAKQFSGCKAGPLKDYNDQISHSSVQLDFQMFINIFLLVLKYFVFSSFVF